MNSCASASIRLIVASCGLAMGGVAHAQTKQWANGSGGLASVGTNWSPTGVPTASNDLVWNLLNRNYTVTFNAAVPTSRTHVYRNSTTSLVMSSPHTVTNGVRIGDLTGDVPTVVLTSGEWIGTAGEFVIGNGTGSSGECRLSGGTSVLRIAGNNDLVVGRAGAGRLHVDAGLVEIGDGLTLGESTGGSAVLSVIGGASQSRLHSLGLGESWWGVRGSAAVSVANFGKLEMDGDVVVAVLGTSNATVTASALASGGVPFIVAGDMSLGRNTLDGDAAGTAHFNCDSSATIGGTLFVGGDPDGGFGTLETAPPTNLTTRSLDIGAGGTFRHMDGRITVDGGAFVVLPDQTFNFDGATGNPVLTLRTTVPTEIAMPGGVAMRVGSGTGANAATVDVIGGSDLVISGGDVELGVGADDSAEMRVTETGSSLFMRESDSTLSVGVAGDALFTAQSGSTVQVSEINIAEQATSTAIARFQSATGTSFTTTRVAVGGTQVARGGSGTLDVMSLATLTVNGGPIRVWEDGLALVQTSGRIVTDGDVEVMGELSVLNTGRVEARRVIVGPSGRIHADGVTASVATIVSEVSLSAGARLDLVEGSMNAGRTGDPDGFRAEAGSDLAIGNNTLTMQDSDGAEIADLEMLAGAIGCTNGIVIQPGSVITGRGRFQAPCVRLSDPTITMNSVLAAFIFEGRLLGHSENLNGHSYLLTGVNAGWTGSGVMNAAVNLGAGGSIVAEGDIRMGNGTATGVTIGSGADLFAGSHEIRLVDSDGVLLRGDNVVNQGRIACDTPLTVDTSGKVNGRGRIATPTLVVNGRLAPGELIGEPLGETGTLGISGGLTLGAAAVTVIQMGGLAADESDLVAVNGPAVLGGQFRVELIRGFNLAGNQTMQVLSGSPISGSFSSIVTPPGYNVVVTADSVIVTRCATDFNGDGFTDFFDYDDYVACYEGVACPPGRDADFNGDGFVDFFDYDDFVLAFETGC